MNKKYIVDPSRTDFSGTVSASQLMVFMSCRKKWVYSYIDDLRPRIERPYLAMGKLCHTGMQHAMRHKFEHSREHGYYREDSLSAGIVAMQGEFVAYKGTNSFLPEEMPDLERTLADAISVFQQAWWEFNPDRWEVLNIGGVPALELHFLVPCAGSKGLHGYIDAILRDVTTGDVWCTDYKFRKSLSDDTEEAFSIQNAIYCRACDKIGIPITGTMTWQHCNTPASAPTLNKNGTMSRAKVKTTWEMYRNELLRAGLNPDDYEEEMGPKLADIEWCRETHEYRNELTIRNIWDNVVVPNAYAIRTARSPKAKNSPSMYPWNCKMCQFTSLCQAELRGYDVDYIKLSEYAVRDLTESTKSDNKPIDDDAARVV